MSSFLQSKTNRIILGTVLLMGCFLAFRWTSSSQLEKQQAELMSGIEDARWGRCESGISENYLDRWGWNRLDLIAVFKDVRSQFLVLGIHFDNPVWDIADRKATMVAHIRLEGTPLGVGSEIQRMVKREKSPLTFSWEKESWTHWSWRLVRMDHPELEIPDSYTPGDLVKARKGQFSF
ncbi:MAG: hypothetical protein ACI8T1_000926 [Verrucomicrobiales bacterium]|jgi:hypothetical protein